MRYLTYFLAAMFFASNAAAAVRVCTVDLAGQGHAVVRALDSECGGHPCPQSAAAALCLTHCTQSYSIGAQRLSADAPLLVLAPALADFHVPIQVQPKPIVLALALPIVGPPATILYGNFRN